MAALALASEVSKQEQELPRDADFALQEGKFGLL